MTDLKGIPENEGKIVEIEGNKVAAFNNKGKIQTFSAICPHMGCEVQWNGSEKTWDCPCHGSKFECDGKLKKGPAKQGLKKLNIK